MAVTTASDPRCLVGFDAAPRAQRISNVAVVTNVCPYTKLPVDSCPKTLYLLFASASTILSTALQSFL